MTYAIVQLKQKPEKKYEETNYFVENNDLWQINGSNEVIHRQEGANKLLNRLGLLQSNEKETLRMFTPSEFREMVRYFIQKKNLFHIHFENEHYAGDDLSINFFDGLKKNLSAKEDLSAQLMDWYDELVEDDDDPIHSITIRTNQTFVTVVYNSVATVGGIHSDQIVLDVYSGIYEALGSSFAVEKVELVLKEKMAHPLHFASGLFEELLKKDRGEFKKENNLSDEAYHKLIEDIRKELKEYENKEVFKNGN